MKRIKNKLIKNELIKKELIRKYLPVRINGTNELIKKRTDP